MQDEVLAQTNTNIDILYDEIAGKILSLRGKRVMLDKDLALLYGVKPIRLREQVKRNIGRFPADFMFQLTKDEADYLVSQNAIPSKRSLGGGLPYAFTEQGVAMLSSVLNSEQAIKVNIQIIRTFTKIRELISTHKELQKKIDDVSRIYGNKLKTHDDQIKTIIEVIQQLLAQPESPQKKIGFIPGRK
ncbi:MAG: ORF6N domain-containing protein [Candidatus Margulisiibacteriota bacterium]